MAHAKVALVGFVFALTALIASPAPAQCTPDILEPDDACAPSRGIVLGSQVRSLNFCDDQGDWLRFNACGGRSYTLETLNLGPSAETVIELYGGDCATMLAVDDDGAGGQASRLAWTAPADGVYHVLVRQSDGTNGPGREYDLSLTGDTSTCATWVREVSGPETERLFTARQRTDGTILASGATDSEGAGQEDITLFHLDVSGNLLFQRTLGTALSERAVSMRLTADGGSVLAGWRWNDVAADPVSTEDGLVVRLDQAGAPVWAKTYGGSDSDRLRDIVEIPGGDYLVVGEIRSAGGSGSTRGWLMRLDPSGNVAWSRSYGNGGEALDEIIAAADGGFAAIGANGSGDAWLLRLDAAGDVSWHRLYSIHDEDIAGRAIENAWGGGFLLGGVTAPVNYMSDSFLVLTDAAGDLLSASLVYAPGCCPEETNIEALERTPDGGYVAAVSIGWGFVYPGLLKLDASAGKVWLMYQDSSNGGRALSAEVLADGGYLLPGSQDYPSDATVVRFDEGGNPPSCVVLDDPGASQWTQTTQGRSSNVKETAFGVTGLDVPLLEFDATLATTMDCRTCTERLYGGLLAVDPNPDGDGARVSWTAGGVQAYDVVVGDLDRLLDTDGDFLLAMETDHGNCLADDSTEYSLIDSRYEPEPGDGYFYLLRPIHMDCPAVGSYDCGSAGQIETRDEEIGQSSNRCP